MVAKIAISIKITIATMITINAKITMLNTFVGRAKISVHWKIYCNK